MAGRAARSARTYLLSFLGAAAISAAAAAQAPSKGAAPAATPSKGTFGADESPPPVEPLYSKPVGVALVAGIYATVYTWAYFAWYKERATSPRLIFADEGMFGEDSYAGGSDKLGHLWGNYIINRFTSKVMEAGGWSPLLSASVATLTTMGFFTFIEFKDGYHEGFGFSWEDMAFNALGNAVAAAMINWPALDDRFDVKVEYRPSKLYTRSLLEHGVVDAGEDYTGQTFMLTYHLGSIAALRSHPVFAPMRFLDVTLGYRAVNYLPTPPEGTGRRQEVSLGVAFDVQELLDLAFDRYDEPRSYPHGAARFVLEGFSVPYTYAPLIRVEKLNGPAPPSEGH